MKDQTVSAFGDFPRTKSIWGYVDQLHDSAKAQQALQELLRRYCPPLKAHLVVRKRMKPEQADDLLQDFVADKVLRLKLIEHADLTKGRFRSFLLTALDRYFIDQMRKRREPLVHPEEFPDTAAP